MIHSTSTSTTTSLTLAPKSSLRALRRMVKDAVVGSRKDTKSSSVQAKARITSIETLTGNIKLVTLKVTTGEVNFQAGQFMGVYDGRKNKKVDHTNSIFPGTFSVASPPSSLPYISFAIGADNNPRNLRNFLYNKAVVGDKIKLDKTGSGTVAITPRMVMTPVGGPGGILLIGGGSAVMGLISIVEELLQDSEGKNIPSITLMHSNRSNKDIPFYDRMKALEREHEQFHYLPFITGPVGEEDQVRGSAGRIGVRDLASVLSGVRLFCVCGSGVFCEAIVNLLLGLGVWPGSIRTDYTTRVDPARRLHELEKLTDDTDSTTTATDSEADDAMAGLPGTLRFEACADATQEKGSMASSGSDYLRTYGLDVFLKKLTTKLTAEQPEFPLQFLNEEIQKTQAILPEISNEKAGDPNFWINYYETDTVTWQAPVVSPWLHKYMKEFLGTSPKTVFVPLCGKSLDMKLLLEAGHHVVGADCSGIACADFFTENSIPDYVSETVAHSHGKRIVRHRSKTLPIELYEGDIFDLTPEIVGSIDAVLDRAALVALPPSIIEDQYLPLLDSLLSKEGGKMLFASVSELPFPKAPPHVYESDMIERLLNKFFSKMELKEVHRYRVNAGHVSEPIYLLSK